MKNIRSSRPEVFCKKGVLRNFTKFTGKHLCQSLFFNKVSGLFTGKHLCQSLSFNEVAGPRPATLLKKETLVQVFACEFREISKNTFSYRTPLVAASKE